MSQLESLREKLYSILEKKGNRDDILKISQELDKLILIYMQQNKKIRTMST